VLACHLTKSESVGNEWTRWNRPEIVESMGLGTGWGLENPDSHTETHMYVPPPTTAQADTMCLPY